MSDNQWMDLAEEAGQLREALAGRAPIEQAKGILISVHRIDPDAAFSMLTKMSSVHNIKVRVLAAALVDVAGAPAQTPSSPVHEIATGMLHRPPDPAPTP